MKKLPSWAKVVQEKPLKIAVDPDKAYPAFFNELGVKTEDVDQYWIEVVYQCVKMELQHAVGGFGFSIKIRGDGKRKNTWALKNHPRGKGPEAATQGREARDHFQKLRGFIPK